ncbi:hypothetical protein LTR41_007487 [Exophiala xenobiotica]|nr:hypothetical protein LTR41_007487 [Exophiala xenobiotica]
MSPYLLLTHMKPLIYDVLFAIDDQEGNSDITKSARDELKECLSDTVPGLEHQRLCLQARKRLHEKKIEMACARMVETLQGELVFLQQLGREVTDQNVDDYNVEEKEAEEKASQKHAIENICKQMRTILSKEPASPMARPEQVVQSLVEATPISNASNPEAINPDVKTPATSISEVGGPVPALENGVLKVMDPKPASDESTSRASAVQSANKTSSSAINGLNQPRTTSPRANEGIGRLSIESPVSAHNDASGPAPIVSNGADIRRGRKKMSILLKLGMRFGGLTDRCRGQDYKTMLDSWQLVNECKASGFYLCRYENTMRLHNMGRHSLAYPKIAS